ncbi:uncharacterized protein HD556DRAFT_1483302 [Suillus plorans]|uniref:CxC5 like cysteine cluster associated with KDZ domain-containing protein n=1 Tax=Suillus plorans TaxID=116603 RepID=A0A9P7DUI8_9AGAM|nr:uncharacterized protein HD556DRAFT_1483302 [Suillus plorans]KAG1803607.1 hypothetical protein HD556DRAFT_1483302 [Suillus plorans]
MVSLGPVWGQSLGRGLGPKSGAAADVCRAQFGVPIISGHVCNTSVTCSFLTSFLRRAKILKEDILQPQPHHVSIFCTPPFLPASVAGFLAASLDMPPEAVEVLWSLVKDIVWELRICANHECAAWQRGSLLKKEEPRRIVLFTHSEGAKPGWMIYLKCRGAKYDEECNTNYQANYSVNGAVTDHQFIKLQLAMHWMDLMQIAVSATNCTNLYAITQTRHDLGDSDDHWQFSNALMTEQVWDCCTLLALLDDHILSPLAIYERHTSTDRRHDDGGSFGIVTKQTHDKKQFKLSPGQPRLPNTPDSGPRLAPDWPDL